MPFELAARVHHERPGLIEAPPRQQHHREVQLGDRGPRHPERGEHLQRAPVALLSRVELAREPRELRQLVDAGRDTVTSPVRLIDLHRAHHQRARHVVSALCLLEPRQVAPAVRDRHLVRSARVAADRLVDQLAGRRLVPRHARHTPQTLQGAPLQPGLAERAGPRQRRLERQPRRDQVAPHQRHLGALDPRAHRDSPPPVAFCGVQRDAAPPVGLVEITLDPAELTPAHVHLTPASVLRRQPERMHRVLARPEQ